MPIPKVSSVNFKNNINFNGKYKQDGQDFSPENSFRPAKYAAAPMAVLMAMNPSLLNSKTIPFEDQNPNVIELETTAPKSSTVTNDTYVLQTNAQQEELPFPLSNWKFFQDSDKDIMLNDPIKIDGKPYHMVWVGEEPIFDEDSTVSTVYFIDDSVKAQKSDTEPPAFVRLRFHRTEDGNFCGAHVRQRIKDAQGQVIETREKEIVLDNFTALRIVYLLTSQTKYSYTGQIKNNEIVKTKELMPEVIKKGEE